LRRFFNHGWTQLNTDEGETQLVRRDLLQPAYSLEIMGASLGQGLKTALPAR
jgi:hypothetical protein